MYVRTCVRTCVLLCVDLIWCGMLYSLVCMLYVTLEPSVGQYNDGISCTCVAMAVFQYNSILCQSLTGCVVASSYFCLFETSDP